MDPDGHISTTHSPIPAKKARLRGALVCVGTIPHRDHHNNGPENNQQANRPLLTYFPVHSEPRWLK
jgi:hypothetical protein